MEPNMLISNVFKIIGSLLVSIIIFTIIYSPAGQNFMWKGIEPAMEVQWKESSMDSGVQRTVKYEDNFATIKSKEYKR